MSPLEKTKKQKKQNTTELVAKNLRILFKKQKQNSSYVGKQTVYYERRPVKTDEFTLSYVNAAVWHRSD